LFELLLQWSWLAGSSRLGAGHLLALFPALLRLMRCWMHDALFACGVQQQHGEVTLGYLGAFDGNVRCPSTPGAMLSGLEHQPLQGDSPGYWHGTLLAVPRTKAAVKAQRVEVLT
jgi:hypothetical protein